MKSWTGGLLALGRTMHGEHEMQKRGRGGRSPGCSGANVERPGGGDDRSGYRSLPPLFGGCVPHRRRRSTWRRVTRALLEAVARGLFRQPDRVNQNQPITAVTRVAGSRKPPLSTSSAAYS